MGRPLRFLWSTIVCFVLPAVAGLPLLAGELLVWISRALHRRVAGDAAGRERGEHQRENEIFHHYFSLDFGREDVMAFARSNSRKRPAAVKAGDA